MFPVLLRYYWILHTSFSTHCDFAGSDLCTVLAICLVYLNAMTICCIFCMLSNFHANSNKTSPVGIEVWHTKWSWRGKVYHHCHSQIPVANALPSVLRQIAIKLVFDIGTWSFYNHNTYPYGEDIYGREKGNYSVLRPLGWDLCKINLQYVYLYIVTVC